MVTILFKITFLCLMSKMLQKGFCNGQPIAECQWSCNKRVTEFTTLCHVTKLCLRFECSNVNSSFRPKMDVINVRYYLCLIDFWTSGHEADAKHWCPVMLLSNFTYSHNDGSATNCGPSNSDLAVCPSWTTMTFNYASCSTVQGFSGRCLFLNKSSLILNT